MFEELTWNEFVKKEMENYEISAGAKKYKKKGYLHLDHRFWFPEDQDEVKGLLERKLQTFKVKNNRLEYHSFYPFLKILTKTPRYRYQFEEGQYDLETKIRPISFASHFDSLIMGYYSFALTKVYEDYIKKNVFDESVLAYRTDLGKNNIQFAKEIFDTVKAKGECSTIALDIKGYFDHINHKILLEKWQKIIGGQLPEDQFKLYNILTKYSYLNPKKTLNKYKGPKKRDEILPLALLDIIPGKSINEKFKQLKRDDLIVQNHKLYGIPQGSPISALLSNIYLIDFDRDLVEKSTLENFVYRRYCDDILIICDTDKAHALIDFVIEKIAKEYFLKIQYEKVDIIDFHENSANKIRGFKRPRKTIKKHGEKDIIKIKNNPAVTSSTNEQSFYKSLQYLGFEYDGKNIIIRPSSLSRFFWKLKYRLQRTVVMAYSPKSLSDQIFLKQIYERYSHLGRRNFLQYAYKAASYSYLNNEGVLQLGLNSLAIKKQMRNHFRLLRSALENKNNKWFSHKQQSKKKVIPKYFK